MAKVMDDKEKTVEEIVDDANALMDARKAEIINGVNQETGEINTPEKEVWFKFDLEKMTMQRGRWTMDIKIETVILKLHMFYEMLWTVDLQPIKERLEKNEQERQEYQMSLLEEEDQKVYKDFDRREAEILKAKAELMARCPDFDFDVGIDAFKNRLDCAIITFHIPKGVVDFLNTHLDDVADYKLQLKRL